MNVIHEYPDVFTTSDTTTKIIKALLEFNAEIGVISKDANNPFFKSAYAPLPTILKDIKDPLLKSRLTINHFPAGDNRLVTRLSHESGEYFQTVSYMVAVKDSPQDRGSLITYMMRYNVGAILGLSIDKDDDGNAVSHQSTQNTIKIVQSKLTDVIKDTMLGFINDGKADKVIKQLPKYADGKSKTDILKAIQEFEQLKSLNNEVSQD